MVLSPRSVRSYVTIRAFTERLLSDSAFDCARISPGLTTFGKAENRGPVTSRDLRLNTARQKWSTRCPFLTAQLLDQQNKHATHLEHC